MRGCAVLSRQHKGRQWVWNSWWWTWMSGWTVRDELSWCPWSQTGWKPVLTLSLYPWSTQPFGLAVFSQQSFSSHSTPPSHCSVADCSSSFRCGCSFDSQFFTSALAQQLPQCPQIPLLPGEKDFTFSASQGLLFACPRSNFFYPNCGVHSLIDLFCIKEPLIVHWALHRAGPVCS